MNGTAGCLFDTIGSVVHNHWVLGPYEERTSRVIFVKVGYYDAQHKYVANLRDTHFCNEVVIMVPFGQHYLYS